MVSCLDGSTILSLTEEKVVRLRKAKTQSMSAPARKSVIIEVRETAREAVDDRVC